MFFINYKKLFSNYFYIYYLKNNKNKLKNYISN